MARKHMADDRKVQLCFWNSNKFLLWKFFGKPAWKGSCHRCFWNVFISLLETRNPTTIVKLFGYYIYIYMDVFVLSKNIINMYTVFCYKRFSFTWNGIRHPKWFLWMENWGYFGSSLNLGKQSNLHGYLLWFTLPCLCACHACNGATQHRWQRVVSKSHCMVVRVLQTKNKTVGTWVFHLYIYIYMYAKLANALCTVAFVTWPLIQPFAQESQIIVYEPSRMHAACCKYMALWKAWASGAGGHA